MTPPVEIAEVDWLRAELARLRVLLNTERPLLRSARLRAPFPYFGNKSPAGTLIWSLLGNPPNLVIPFAGSLGELWTRPDVGKIETINDIDGLVANVWRAIQADPDAVAGHADWPVIEVDLHAWHRVLVEASSDLAEKLRTDPRYFDAELAGRWIWGASSWIGSGWCDPTQLERNRNTRPHLSNAGVGVVAVRQQLPHLAGCDGTGVGYGKGIHNRDGRLIDALYEWMRALSDRLRHVRVICGDFERVVTPAVTISHGPTAIIWDPPYTPGVRAGGLYASDDPKGTPTEHSTAQRAAARARALAAEHGDLVRQIFCGYEAEHEFPGWSCIPWRAKGGYGLQAHGRGRENRERERMWVWNPYAQPEALQLSLDALGGLL